MMNVLPTTDLYFLNSCRGWLRRWWRAGPVKRLGANSFRSDDRHLLIRRDEPDLMDAALNGRDPLIYLIDDDIIGAAQSQGLPAAYRARLADFAERYHDRLLRRAETIVTSSDVLATKFRSNEHISANIVRLDPFWGFPLADQRHFPSSPDVRFDIVHLGTASHVGALGQIAPAVIATLNQFSNARFTFIAAPGHHPALEAHPRTRRVNVMSWRRYRRWLPQQRFLLALYPLEQTPFDRARSANKIFEHAVVGAVGVYPCNWDPAAMVAGGAILAPEDPTQWMPILIKTIEQRLELASLGKAAMTSLTDRHNEAAQRRIWASLLNLDTNGQVVR